MLYILDKMNFIQKKGDIKMASLLLLVQQREQDPRTRRVGKGIGLASSYLATFEQSVGGFSKMTQFGKAHKLFDWSSVLKAARNKLIYGDDQCNILRCQKDASPIVRNQVNSRPAEILNFDAIMTSRNIDRDGDILDPMGASVDPKAPLLFNHMPADPVGRFWKITDQNPQFLSFNGGIANTAMGNDMAVLVEMEALRISHGFEPTEYEPIEGEFAEYKSPVAGMEEVGHGFLVSKYKTMEVSLVSIPANADAEITASSRKKLSHPLVKLLADSKFENRKVIVPSGFEAKKMETQPVIVNVNMGDLLTKHVKRRKAFSVQPSGEGFVVVDDNGEQVGPTYPSQAEADEARVNAQNMEDSVGEELSGKRKSSRKDYSVKPAQGGFIVVDDSGKQVGPVYTSETEANATRIELLQQAWGETSTTAPSKKAKKEEEMASTSVEEGGEVEGVEGEGEGKGSKDAVLSGIQNQIKTLGKMKGLSREAKARVNLMSDMAGDLMDSMSEHQKQVGKLLSGFDLVGVKEMHDSHLDSVAKGLERICRELDGLADVESLNDDHKKAVSSCKQSISTMMENIRSVQQPLLNKDDPLSATDDGLPGFDKGSGDQVYGSIFGQDIYYAGHLYSVVPYKNDLYGVINNETGVIEESYASLQEAARRVDEIDNSLEATPDEEDAPWAEPYKDYDYIPQMADPNEDITTRPGSDGTVYYNGRTYSVVMDEYGSYGVRNNQTNRIEESYGSLDAATRRVDELDFILDPPEIPMMDEGKGFKDDGSGFRIREEDGKWVIYDPDWDEVVEEFDTEQEARDHLPYWDLGWVNWEGKDGDVPLTSESMPDSMSQGVTGPHEAAQGDDGKFYVWEGENSVAGPFDTIEQAQQKADELNKSENLETTQTTSQEL